jgi:prepilin-type N-terminal cleavage/methylation domain-containing protein
MIKRLPKSNATQRGVSLMECLVSMALFLIVTVGIAGGSASFMKQNTTNEQKGGAIAATQQAFDNIRFQDPSTLPMSGTVSSTVAVGGRNYDVRLSYCETSSYCSSLSLRHVTARTYFKNVKLYQVETVYAQLK